MKISRREVEYVAKLARLSLTEEEKEKYAVQLGKILEYINKLNHLDTRTVSPTAHVVNLYNVFRKDEVKPSLAREEVLFNAPEEERGHFKVKKIIEEYPQDRPMRSFLTIGYTRTEEPLHIVIAVDNEDNMLWVITVYRPDPNEWESGFTRRIRR